MKKKRIAVIAAGALAVILVFALVITLGDKKTVIDGEQRETEQTNDEVIVAEITVSPEVTPAPVTTAAETKAKDVDGNIDLTETEDKPAPPDNPYGDETDNDHDVPDEPEMTDPEKKPDATVPPVDPKPAQTTPSGGKPGEIYVPGFGWIKDEGGGGQGQKSDSDGDWDKIIGY